MELIPAIDLLGGRVVRLTKGDYDAVTVYADDPAEPARRFHAEGARRLHVVDLDGARDGTPGNVEAVERIVAAAPLSVQVGGGIRDRAAAERWLSAGCRVVLGTAAVESPELVRQLVAIDADRVIVALDARDGEVAVDGWTRGSGRDVGELAREVVSWGVRRILYTNIERDGTRVGPDVDGTAELTERLGIEVIASGGIGALEHLTELARRDVRAAVCGRALYAGVFTYAEAIAVLDAAGTKA